MKHNENFYDEYGYDRNGYDINGYNIYGFDADGHDKYGRDENGFTPEDYKQSELDDTDHILSLLDEITFDDKEIDPNLIC